MQQKTLMIGVSTEQNTTNLIPALQLKADDFLLIETSIAKKQKWSNGLIKILKSKNINVIESISLDFEEDTRIDFISSKLSNFLENEDYKIIWNLGGGQKAQQFALWQTFLARTSKNKNDQTCYTNPSTHKIEKWYFENNELKYKNIPITYPLELNEILSIFGFEIKEKGELIYSKKIETEQKELVNYMNYLEFRELSYKTSSSGINFENTLSLEDLKQHFDSLRRDENLLNLFVKSLDKMYKDYRGNQSLKNISSFLNKNILNYIQRSLVKKPEEYLNIENTEFFEALKNNGFIKNKLPIDISTFKEITSKTKFSIYFEEFISKKVQEILKSKENNIFEAYQNIKIAKEGEKTEAAEYDILLVTKWGTLIALDPKTYDFEKKDADARDFNLQRMGGKYVDFIAVIPYYIEDLNKEYFPNKLKQLPFNLNLIGKKFFVLSNEKNDVFKIKDEAGKILSVTEGGLNCTPIELFLEKLNLI